MKAGDFKDLNPAKARMRP